VAKVLGFFDKLQVRAPWCMNAHGSLRTVNMVQTAFMFSGSVRSPLQPAGFAFCCYFVRLLGVEWTFSAALCDCFIPAVASSPRKHFCVVFNLGFSSCALALQVANSSSA